MPYRRNFSLRKNRSLRVMMAWLEILDFQNQDLIWAYWSKPQEVISDIFERYHLHEAHGIGRDEMENMGFLKAIPLVIIKAVTESPDLKQTKIKGNDLGSDESEGEVEEPIELMPKHFDREEAFFSNLSTLSRSDSAAALDLDPTAANITEPRPSSACTDTSDTSMNASFEVSNPSEVDESNFDASTLMCKLCNKVLKNMRTFRNHKARHLGTLNHKCPDCSKFCIIYFSIQRVCSGIIINVSLQCD